MKKALAITAGLLLVLSLSASYLVTALAAPQEQLQYTEHGIYGDLSAAEGLLLTRTLRLGKNMRWTSSLQFAEGSCRRETLLEETGEDLWRQDMQSRQAVTYGARLYSELCTLASMQMNSEMAMGKEGSIAKAIFDRTPAGESRTEQVLLKEYLDHYPIMWEVYSENVDVYMAGLSLTEDELLDPQTKQVLRDLEAFFRIPVLPQQCMYLAVEKDAAGNFLQCYEAFGQEAEPLLTERYDFSGSGVFAKDNCFLWFDNRTSFGNTVDTGLIPGGYGIYILPTGITGYEELRSGGTRPVWGILSDQLRVFYSLDPEDTVLQVEVSENEENLLALVRRGGHAFALVIDAKTG
ncbi:MAG: hypothetical protein HUJ80_07050, partial [Firmicutes bacterium]|nr:hypothetical protein [Bacillota bacterium]